MNTRLLILTRYLVGIALALWGLSWLFFGLPVQGQSQRDQDQCDPWQYRDENGDCVDKPHVHHYHAHTHMPESGEQCWVECLCERGTYPASDNCAPCEFVGTVCIGR